MTIPLGKAIAQPTTYSPQSLSPIARSIGRKVLAKEILQEMAGYDIWTCWECSWLDNNGIPQQSVLQIIIPADSPNIVESKSLKLYLNSLNNHCVGTQKDLLVLLEKDLSPVIDAKPNFKILEKTQLQRKQPQGKCVDDYREKLATLYSHNCRLEAIEDDSSTTTENQANIAYSELFRSLCPVTAQPDYATVYAHNSHLQPQSLLTYWLSFRNHKSFHEQCIEQMYCDFCNHIQHIGKDIRHLKTGGAFTRRGGIDIHPIRYHRDYCEKSESNISYTYNQ